MDKRTEAQAVRDCLQTPGARVIARKLRQASKGVLKKYDKCKPEDLVRHQILRAVLNEELPRIIEGLVNPKEEKKKFDWKSVLRL